MATLQERIDAIDAILDRGLTRVTDQDGRTHEYDLDALRKRRDDLVAEQNGCGPRLCAGVYNSAYPDG